MEQNLVEIWLRRDPVRWIAGILGGLFAGAVAMAVAMALASSSGLEPTFPAKLMGTIVLGPEATEIGQSQGMIAGIAIFELICLFWGFVYAHFTGTNKLSALLPMGLVWGVFSWIFIWNLFMQSILPIRAAQIPTAAALLICMTYGVSLASVSIFDGIFRGKTNRK